MQMSNRLELRHIRCFLAVAEELHFHRAAEKLYLSQPALSRQIKQMEEYLGISLFERSSRKVILTEAGRYLVKEYKIMLKQVETSSIHALLLHQGLTGRLKLGYVGSAMQNVIPSFLIQVRDKFPNVQFDLNVMDNLQQIEAILSHTLDLGFVRVKHTPSGINQSPVFRDNFSLILPANHPLNKENFEGLHQVKEEPFILFDPAYSPSYFEEVMQIFEKSGFNPRISHQTIHVNTIYKLVENHFGLSVIPSSFQEGYEGKVTFIDLSHTGINTSLQAIWSKSNQSVLLKNVLPFLNYKEEIDSE